MQQKLLSYVLRGPFCIVLKVGCASVKKWEFRRGGNVTGITSNLIRSYEYIGFAHVNGLLSIHDSASLLLQRLQLLEQFVQVHPLHTALVLLPPSADKHEKLHHLLGFDLLPGSSHLILASAASIFWPDIACSGLGYLSRSNSLSMKVNNFGLTTVPSSLSSAPWGLLPVGSSEL